VDASHAGEWNKQDAADNPDTARSRTGYVFMFANCPIIWMSRLQTEIALFSTEAEYIALSTATREVVPLLQLMKEAKQHGMPIHVEQASFHCRIFEDNAGAIEMAKNTQNASMNKTPKYKIYSLPATCPVRPPFPSLCSKSTNSRHFHKTTGKRFFSAPP
jgi:hypothetical protein